jgi:Lon protease-like protein
MRKIRIDDDEFWPIFYPSDMTYAQEYEVEDAFAERIERVWKEWRELQADLKKLVRWDERRVSVAEP